MTDEEAECAEKTDSMLDRAEEGKEELCLVEAWMRAGFAEKEAYSTWEAADW